LADDVHLDVIARLTPGFTGADLENLLNEAALLAARRNKRVIEMVEIESAIDRVIAGPEKRSRRVSELEKKIVAYHEAGHAVVGYFLQHADTVHKVTIIPRGMAGGYNIFLPKEDRFLMQKQELLDRVSGLLGGRVAEEIVFGDISTGASNDLERATQIVRAMVTEYGMSEKLGNMQFGHRQGQVFLGRDFTSEQNYSDAIAHEIDKEMRHFIDLAYTRTKEVLLKHRDKLELLAQTLLEVETLDAEQIKQLMETGRLEKKNGEIKVNISSSTAEGTNPSTQQTPNVTIQKGSEASPEQNNENPQEKE
jgi:cell division protease FtsH